MKVLVIKTESMLPKHVLLDAQKEIEKCASSGILLLDGRYTYEVVDIDMVEVKEPEYTKEYYSLWCNDAIFPTRKDAVEFVNQMLEIINKYGHATVEDYCDLRGVIPNYSDSKYGWYSLKYEIKTRYNKDISNDFYYEVLLTNPYKLKG